jgi:hypothetical protein
MELRTEIGKPATRDAGVAISPRKNLNEGCEDVLPFFAPKVHGWSGRPCGFIHSFALEIRVWFRSRGCANEA